MYFYLLQKISPHGILVCIFSKNKLDNIISCVSFSCFTCSALNLYIIYSYVSYIIIQVPSIISTKHKMVMYTLYAKITVIIWSLHHVVKLIVIGSNW